MAKYRTTEKWVERQAALRLTGLRRWEVSFLATSQGSITELSGQVAEFETTSMQAAHEAMFGWILAGEVPELFQTHSPSWFEPVL